MGAQPIYLDNNSTTALDPRVLTAMLPTFTEHYGNPASSTHSYGWYAEELVKIAREQVAALIGAHAEEIVFTSGATEANALAIAGHIKALRRRAAKLRIVSVTTEHRAVLDLLEDLAKDGVEIELVPVGLDGRVDPEQVKAALTPGTSLLSVMMANNEIGAVPDLAAIGKIAAEARVIFHTDATQAAGKIAIEVGALGVDLLSLSAHKLYGPKGVGALWIRRRSPKLPLQPLQLGGGQERGLRGGTLNVPSIVGFGQAAALACAERASESARLNELTSRFLQLLTAQQLEFSVNGHREGRLPGNLNIAFAGVTSARLIGALNAKIAFSATSACSSRRAEPSHVLRALGIDDERLRESVRFGFGRFTTGEEIEEAAALIANAVLSLRSTTT